MSRTVLNYESCRRENPKFIKAVFEIKEKYPFYGTPRVHVMLRRQGFHVNRKRVRRILNTLGLAVPRKEKRCRLNIIRPQQACEAKAIGDVWAMDFVFDRLSNGEPFRCFTVIDTLSREVPGIFVSKSMAGFTPIKFLEQLKSEVKLPKHFILDNGSEFANSVFIKWCSDNQIQLNFIDPGKPVQNAFIESFNGKFRTEFLKQNRFHSIKDVQRKLPGWIKYYNEERPHSSLDYLTPKEFVQKQIDVLDEKINRVVLKTG